MIFQSKVFCDATSRLAILGIKCRISITFSGLQSLSIHHDKLGAWVYTVNSGNFNTHMTVSFYYTLATINFIENLAFSIHKNEDIVSFRNVTGVHEREYNVFKK